jgi:hypothetical protein
MVRKRGRNIRRLIKSYRQEQKVRYSDGKVIEYVEYTKNP